jgi:hypothetical protein
LRTDTTTTAGAGAIIIIIIIIIIPARALSQASFGVLAYVLANIVRVWRG